MLLSRQQLRASPQHCRELAAVMRDNAMRLQILNVAGQYDRLAGNNPRGRIAKRCSRAIQRPIIT